MGAGQIIQLISMLLPLIQQDGPLVFQGLHDFIGWIEGAVTSNPTQVQAVKASLLTAAQKGK